MTELNAESFHRLYGARRPRINFRAGDFIDYALMLTASAAVLYLSYGPSLLTGVGLMLCLLMAVTFASRHGVSLRRSALFRRPQELAYMILYKLQNLRAPYFFALATLLLENYLIYLTPSLPHHVEWMRQIALIFFYGHLLLISGYRTAILVAHLRRRERVRDFLRQTSWAGAIAGRPITVEIVHAYCTGLLAHMLLIAPWFIVIRHLKFSIVFFPVVAALNVLVHMRFIKVINSWFYRDHWLGHNSEFEFIYLHGSHHDAIPCGLIGVAGNGYLEGFLRHLCGFPSPLYNPLIAFLVYTLEVKQDIETHQYIPGVYPASTREFQEVTQHSTHHFGRLEPYGFAINVDQPGVSEKLKEGFKLLPDELKNSIRLDETLTGFEWDNVRHRAYLDLFDKYST